MSFHSILFPEDLSYGTRGGQGFSTSIHISDSGVESRFAEWESNRGRIQYDVAKSVQTTDELAALLDFFVCMRGAACGFRFKDPTDFTSAEDGVTAPATMADAHHAPLVHGELRTYQIQKLYKNPYTAAEDPAQYRTITRPIPPGNADHNIRVYVGSTLVWKSDASGSGTVAQGFVAAIDYDTGRIILSKTTGATVKVACAFHVPVRFGQEIDDGLDVSWDGAGHFSIATVPIVELTTDPHTDAEEWCDGGHIAVPVPPNDYSAPSGILWFTSPAVQQQHQVYDFNLSATGKVLLLGQFHATGTVTGSRLYPPTKSGENYLGGPYTMIKMSGAAAPRSLKVLSFGADGKVSMSPNEAIFDNQYSEYYWFGDTTKFKSR